MGITSGTGRVLLDLGLIEHFGDEITGEIGGPRQPSTLLITFRTEGLFRLQVTRQEVQPFTDRFIQLALRDPDDAQIPLGDGGHSPDRLPGGTYAVAISTSQWQRIPFRIQLRISSQESLRCAMGGAGHLVGGMPITRLQGALAGAGSLWIDPNQRRGLTSALTGEGRLWLGLVAQPTYDDVPVPGLAHAWAIETDAAWQVGSGDGSTWLQLSMPPSPNYLETVLGLPDFRGGFQRLIFSARSPGIYGTYADIGPSPADVTTPLSLEAPGIPFQSLVQGSYRRSCVLSLPIASGRQVLAIVREELRWSNDIVRDLDTSTPFRPKYVAANRYSNWAHQRTVRLLIVGRSRVRILRSIPGTFMQQLNQVLPPLNRSMVVRRLTVPGINYSRARVDCLVPAFALTGQPPSEGDQVLALDPHGSLLASFGMSDAMQARQGYGSAAIYDYLADSASIYAESDYDRRSYSFVNRVLTGRPAELPQYSPWEGDGGYAGGRSASQAYDDPSVTQLCYGRWSGPFPADASTALELSGDQWQQVNLNLVLAGGRQKIGQGPRALIAHDWGVPEYCRLRLGQLGFTSGDLLDYDVTGKAALLLNPGDPAPLQGAGGFGRGTLTVIHVVRLSGALKGRGGLGMERLFNEQGLRLKGRGRLAMRLTVMTRTDVAALQCAMAGRGRLVGGVLVAWLHIRMHGRGGLGRPVLWVTPDGLAPVVLLGRGSMKLTGPRVSHTLVLAAAFSARGSLDRSRLIVALVRVLGTALSAQGSLNASTLVIAKSHVLFTALSGTGGLGESALGTAMERDLAASLVGTGGLAASRLSASSGDYFADMSVQAFGWEEMIFVDWWGN